MIRISDTDDGGYKVVIDQEQTIYLTQDQLIRLRDNLSRRLRLPATSQKAIRMKWAHIEKHNYKLRVPGHAELARVIKAIDGRWRVSWSIRSGKRSCSYDVPVEKFVVALVKDKQAKAREVFAKWL